MATMVGATDLYVAPDGDDAALGTIDKPLASLTGARDAVRKRIASDGGILREPVSVYFRGGLYRFNETVVFGTEDSGSAVATITYAAYKDETPVFSGGVIIPVQEWKRTEFQGGRIWCVYLPWVRINGGFHALFDGERLLPRARSKRFENSRVMVRGDQGWEEKAHAGEPYLLARRDRYTKLHCAETMLANTSNLSDVELFMRPEAKWLVNYLPLKSCDSETGVLETTIEGTYPLTRDFYLENALEFLDEPGEWSLNTETGMLYYWPESGKPGESVVAPWLPALVRVEGENDLEGHADNPVRGLAFRGLTFTHCNRDVWTRDDIGIQHDWDMWDKDNSLLRFRGAEDCVVDSCRFVNSGSDAVRVDLHGQRITIQNNVIRNIGGTGILLSGYGPGTKDVNRNNLVLNNDIENCGTLYWHGLGVFIWQSGHNRIAHNRIHNLGYMGMVISGVRVRFFGQGRFTKERGDNPNRREFMKAIRWSETSKAGNDEDWAHYEPYMHARDNVIEYNEIFNCMQRLTDGNCIYLSASGAGNVVRRNFVHSHVKNNMIRTDDDQYDALVTENIIIGNVSEYGYALKRVNCFENNILVQSIISGQGAGGGPEAGSSIKRNIIVHTDAEKMRFFVNTKRFALLQKDEVDYNLYYGGGTDREKTLFNSQQKQGWDRHSIVADPLFQDLAGLDFRLKSESPAFKLGIKQIEGLDRIGLLHDPAIPRLRKAGGLAALMAVEAHPSEVFHD
jgi:hypothetical protein